ncbi:hypothetical protein EUGRSUZ_E02139 [Eucalyptus grandis]|uniref:Uncharacterized protein n=2 Tax=Eucalyptus grandis TaxID=71139 RepID=A0ACC3KY11_EUCGR|nr:hypothetical protein EUGRSUZ_E02139 [Eucalyptus grandis]
MTISTCHGHHVADHVSEMYNSLLRKINNDYDYGLSFSGQVGSPLRPRTQLGMVGFPFVESEIGLSCFETALTDRGRFLG